MESVRSGTVKCGKREKVKEKSDFLIRLADVLSQAEMPAGARP